MSGQRNITGEERSKFTNEWIVRGRPRNREDFIKRACEHFGINYVPVPRYMRERNVITDEKFPTKNKEEKL